MLVVLCQTFNITPDSRRGTSPPTNLGTPAAPPATRVCGRFARRRWTACAIKRGERGPLSPGLAAAEHPAFPAATAVVDTTAAGDSFIEGATSVLQYNPEDAAEVWSSLWVAQHEIDAARQLARKDKTISQLQENLRLQGAAPKAGKARAHAPLRGRGATPQHTLRPAPAPPRAARGRRRARDHDNDV